MHALRSESLGAVLKTALDAVVVMRMDGTIAGWNDVAERTFGWSFAEADGRRMSEIIIPFRYREAHEKGLSHFHATGEGPVLDKHIEIEGLHRDGHELPIELSITRTNQFDEPVFLGFLRDISERRDAQRRQTLMVGELNHRVKNLLGVVAGIAHQTARASATIEEFTPAFGGRLSSLGKAHEILTAAVWEEASMHALVTSLLGSYAEGLGAPVTIDGPDTMLAPRHLLSISMIIHELLGNAVKYGALATPTGRIAVAWSVEGEEVKMHWVETGVGQISAPSRSGFGSKMITLNVRHDLRGRSSTGFSEDGLVFELRFPLAQMDGR